MSDATKIKRFTVDTAGHLVEREEEIRGASAYYIVAVLRDDQIDRIADRVIEKLDERK